MSVSLQKSIYNNFDPNEALKPGDPCYVDFSGVRGSDDLIGMMTKTISFADRPTYQLLSGHRGCGKSTELLRLQKELVSQDPRYFVVYFEADKYINMQDPDYPDLLLSIIQNVWIEAKEKGIQLSPGRFQSFVLEISEFLTAPVAAKTVDVDAFFFKLGFEIEKNSNFRSIVRQKLSPQAPALLEAVNEIIDSANKEFQSRGYNGLVIIVDNLDRIFRKTIAGTNYVTHDALFINAGNYLSGISCHMIYTIPLALRHSLNGANLPIIFGRTAEVMPMVPVRHRFSSEKNNEGIAKLTETIERRIINAGAKMETAFDPARKEEIIERLCLMSGGFTRNLLTLVQEATLYANKLPIAYDDVERAVRAMRDERVITIQGAAQWKVLREVHESGETNKSKETIEDTLNLLNNLSIMEYRDLKGYWYDVNPVFLEAMEFKG